MIVVKRKGHRENFDEKKVYGSVYAACLNAHMHEGKCEEIAGHVSGEVRKWAEEKKQVDSKEIMEKTHLHLEKKSRDAAFLYKTHLDVS